MRGRTATRAPVIDEGETWSIVAVALEVLAPSWSRLHATLLVLVPMMAVLAIWETFRLPEPAIATFLLLLIARGDSMSTISSSFLVAATVSLGALLAVTVTACSLSQPALRIPLMALMTFVTMLLVRGTRLGPIAFLAGFFAIFGSTDADDLVGLAATPADVTNTEGFGRPEIDYFPPEEALLHALLWLGVIAAVPAMLLAAANRVAGADPLRLMLERLRARTEVVTAFCHGEPGASDRLRGLAREGLAPLLALMGAAERAHGTESLHDAHLRIAGGLNRLDLLLVAWDMARPGDRNENEAPFLRPVGEFVTALASHLHPRRNIDTPLPSLPPDGAEDALAGALPSLAAEIRVVLDLLRGAETTRQRALVAAPPPPPHKPFWQPGAFAAPNIQNALKVTLTVMGAYLIESGLDWQDLSSCIITCLFVALGTIGETVHKMTLRIAGCLFGAALGLGSILWLMPDMTGFGQLAALFGAVAFISIWIAVGSPRIAYAGWQTLLAFGLTTLQGYGPTLDMEAARDRVIGILLGNLVITLVFLFVWPARIGDAVRRDMASAFETLGKLLALEGDAAGPDGRRAAEARLRDGFMAAVTRVGVLIPDDRFEPLHASGDGTGRLGRGALGRLSRLIAPVSVIATDGVEPLQRDAIPQGVRDEVRAYHHAMQDWFGQAASWILSGERQDELRAALPRPPAVGDLPSALPAALAERICGRAALYALVTRQVTEFLDDALPPNAHPMQAGAQRSPSIAVG